MRVRIFHTQLLIFGWMDYECCDCGATMKEDSGYYYLTHPMKTKGKDGKEFCPHSGKTFRHPSIELTEYIPPPFDKEAKPL